MCPAVRGAAAPAIATVRVDTLLVAAPAAPGRITPAVTGLVTRLELESETGLGELTDLLARVAGLQMAQLGGWGTSAVPSLRGSSAAQIRFFVDGMPLPAARSGLAAFDRVPLERLQAVEIHRGVVPASLGGMGGAGAINFITRDEAAGADLAVQTGAFGEAASRVTAAGHAAGQRLSGRVGAYGHRADNDFSFVDHNQTFHRADDDTARVRRNAWLREHGAWGSANYHGGRLRLRTSLAYDRRDGGRPGPLAYPSPHASVRYDRLDGQLHLDWDDGLCTLAVSGGRGHDYLYHPVAGEIGFRPPGVSDDISDDLYGRLVFSPTRFSETIAISAGSDWRGQWQNETIGSAMVPERSRRSVAAFATLVTSWAAGRLTVAPSWRWQHTADNFSGTPTPTDSHRRREDISPALGAVWTLADQRLFLSGHLARSVRNPAWIELFGQRGGIDGNPGLSPETIDSADLALSVRGWGPVSARVAAFRAATTDKIIFIQNSQRTSKAINLGRSLSRGLEVELTAALPANLDLSGNLTWQRVTDDGPDPAYTGKSLPFLPDLEAHGRLAWRLGDWHPWLDGALMSANYRDRANTELDRAPARTRWNLGLSRDWYPAWLGQNAVVSLLGEVINLTNNNVYDVEGYPLPGRYWRLAARLRR